ncbi:response regulator [Paenibacillus apiarius]|uniref:Response regulator n=1 Tax=Paenibacillus apiarius TaxID=46240 RepID=A0ABT4DMW2_9BACL|nr:response regulator [Paenibacillus apiarius]MCY9514705.1 response regulator [Paenibacillus apiarius]MCY9518695.1 response regulator [Paenibacillus apiarius]MCY9552864.1 response regulator [Paenibacillus apiarius]MCY9556889.1 response regulator [Paenibacillus apiarius]MCY9686158.1 response regulator [Paenibacillus apiarius]
MYKVLLADDEMLDLEGMKQFIPWSELGLEVVGAVNNGFSACEVMEQQSVDILVTDVNMPNMSGLELAQRAIDKKPDVRIIFVSGYQDFHYVKQALSLKACSYVLKPMDDDELIASLHKVIQELEEEQRRREAEEDYQYMIPMAKNDLLIRIFEGDLTWYRSGGSMRLASSYGLEAVKWPVRVAVMELDDAVWLQPGSSEAALQDMRAAFLYEIREISLRHGMPHCCKLSRQRLAILMDDEGARDCIAEMYNSMKSKLSLSMTIGLGKPIASLDQVHISYKQALEALDGKMFLGRGNLIDYEDVRRAPELKDARTLDIRLDALFKAMSQYELVSIHDEIENLFQSVCSLRSKFTVHNLAMYIVWKLDQYLDSTDENLFDMLGMDLHNLDILLQFETVGDIRSWLIRKVFEISELLHEKDSSKNSKLIREILKTVKERLHENITLKDISHQFSFSPNYLGHLFKEEVGKTFSEMLIQIRMERACELLKDPTLKIYEVADQVGYRYIPYFSRQFKETFGMTPMEFRKRES